jgi:hypothetical protein
MTFTIKSNFSLKSWSQWPRGLRHELSSLARTLTRRAPFTLQEDSWYSFLFEAESTPGHNVAWSIRSIEKSNDLIGNRTHDIPACSIVSQPTMLPRASHKIYNSLKASALQTCFFLSMALQPFGPWPRFQFLNPIRSRKDSLEGGSARRKAATYTSQHKHRIKAHVHLRYEWESKPTIRVWAGEDSSCLRPRGHCDRLSDMLWDGINIWRNARINNFQIHSVFSFENTDFRLQ